MKRETLHQYNVRRGKLFCLWDDRSPFSLCVFCWCLVVSNVVLFGSVVWSCYLTDALLLKLMSCCLKNDVTETDVMFLKE